MIETHEERDRNFHKKYINSKQFAAVKEYVFSRDEHRCVVCGRTENLVCHHRSYKHLGEANLNEIADCVTLCNTCHYAHHKHSANLYWYSIEHPRNRNDLSVLEIEDKKYLINEDATSVYEVDTYKSIPVKHLKRNNYSASISINGEDILL